MRRHNFCPSKAPKNLFPTIAALVLVVGVHIETVVSVQSVTCGTIVAHGGSRSLYVVEVVQGCCSLELTEKC